MDTTSSGAGRTESILPSSTSAASGSVAAPAFDSRQLHHMSTTLELLVTSMARFESRLNEVDQRTSVQRPPPRPEQDPPSALPPHWFSNPLPTTGPTVAPTHSIIVSTPNPPGFPAFQPIHVADTQGLRPTAASIPTTYPTHRFPSISQEIAGSRPSRAAVPTQQPAATAAWDQHIHNSNLGLSRASPTSWDIPSSQIGFDPPSGRPTSSWDNPAARQHSSFNGLDQPRRVKMDQPRFDGTDVANWISRVQYYFDHLMLPEEHRLHYVVMLFEPTVA